MCTDKEAAKVASQNALDAGDKAIIATDAFIEAEAFFEKVTAFPETTIPEEAKKMAEKAIETVSSVIKEAFDAAEAAAKAADAVFDLFEYKTGMHTTVHETTLEAAHYAYDEAVAAECNLKRFQELWVSRETTSL
jgi:hypothetical protein